MIIYSTFKWVKTSKRVKNLVDQASEEEKTHLNRSASDIELGQVQIGSYTN
jgi:hypothetical protein